MSNEIPDFTIRVLLADDHEVVRAGIRLFLEHDPRIRVIAEAQDGQQACDLIHSLKPDVAVLDIQMPVKSGIEAIRWVRAQHLTTGLLVLTAYDDAPYVQAVLQAGANGYVLKTASTHEIIQAVIDTYQGKQVIDAALASRLPPLQATPPAQTLAENLTDREIEILALTATGLTNKAIAVKLSISDRTVQNHLANIFVKLRAESRTEAVMKAVTLGLISPSAHPTR